MKKLVYVLIAMAFPFVISSCKSEAAKQVDAICDCYAEQEALTDEAFDKLDAEKKEALMKCVEKATEGLKDEKKDDLSDEEQISLLEERIAAIDGSDCKDLAMFKKQKEMMEAGLKALKEKGGEDKKEE